MSYDSVIDAWFRLAAAMPSQPTAATALRPPSLRDACYAYTLSIRSASETTPETIESFVNGLELGALIALQQAWKKR